MLPGRVTVPDNATRMLLCLLPLAACVTVPDNASSTNHISVWGCTAAYLH